MKVIILAAGQGGRLRPLTADRPKCMVQVNGRTILDYQLDALAQAGLTDVTIVIGYRGDTIRDHVGWRCRFIVNEAFETTDNMYSLWLARDLVAGEAFVFCNSDVIVEASMIRDLVNCPHSSAMLVDTEKELSTRETNLVIENGWVTEYHRDIPLDRANAQGLFTVKLGAEGSRLLFERIDEFVRGDSLNYHPSRAFDAVLPTVPVAPIDANGRPWFEIDTLEDLADCRRRLGQRG